ncbi:hypothetical protein [Acinetobacter nematophilus]|uniref:Uncharacterized protein n=1 Tax=Acinetobacter nematophilus TaxID=2994642 RepID=A0A9X3IIH7_9GAMM|nr:hypothetical protein [Acinetobacter nematophilus]MCX5469912.1 hypothetical protein [Acinetobacter nematophilus]
MFLWGNRLHFNLSPLILFILIAVGVGYGCYSTVRHVQAVNQLNEARKALGDIRTVLIWSSAQYPHNAIKTCNFKNIQQASAHAEFQKINQLFDWNVSVQQQTQYLERIKVFAINDLQTCMIKVYFKYDHSVSDDLAGKYIAYRYDLKNNKTECLTNIEKYSLVKFCTR